MKFNEIIELKSIMSNFDSDYRLSEQVLARHDELDKEVKNSDIRQALRSRMADAGVRSEVIEAAFEDMEFEESIGALVRDLTGIVARYDIADQVHSAMDAA